MGPFTEGGNLLVHAVEVDKQMILAQLGAVIRYPLLQVEVIVTDHRQRGNSLHSSQRYGLFS